MRPFSAPSRVTRGFPLQEAAPPGGEGQLFDVPPTAMHHERPVTGAVKLKSFFAVDETTDTNCTDASHVTVSVSGELVSPLGVRLRRPASVVGAVRSETEPVKRRAPPPPPPLRLSSLQGFADQSAEMSTGDLPAGSPDIQSNGAGHSNGSSRRSLDRTASDNAGESSPKSSGELDVSSYMLTPSVPSPPSGGNHSAISAVILRKPKIPVKPKLITIERSSKGIATVTAEQKRHSMGAIIPSYMNATEAGIATSLNATTPKKDSPRLSQSISTDTPIPPPRKKHARRKLCAAQLSSSPKTVVEDVQTHSPINGINENVISPVRSANSLSCPHTVERSPRLAVETSIDRTRGVTLLTSLLQERHRTDGANTVNGTRTCYRNARSFPQNDPCRNGSVMPNIDVANLSWRSDTISDSSRHSGESPLPPSPHLSCDPRERDHLSAVGSLPPPQFDVASLGSGHSRRSAAYSSPMTSSRTSSEVRGPSSVHLPPPPQFDSGDDVSAETSIPPESPDCSGSRLLQGGHGLPLPSLNRSLPGPRSCGDLSILVEDDYVPHKEVRVPRGNTDPWDRSIAASWRVDQPTAIELSYTERCTHSDGASCSSDTDSGSAEDRWGLKPAALWDVNEVIDWCNTSGFDQLVHIFKGSSDEQWQ